jgi:hypothetical protein
MDPKAGNLTVQCRFFPGNVASRPEWPGKAKRKYIIPKG